MTVNLKDICDVITAAVGIVSAIGVIFSIRYAVKQQEANNQQQRRNNQVAESQILSSLYSRLDSINAIQFNNPVILAKLSQAYDAESGDFDSVNTFIQIVKSFFTEVIYHHKNSLISEEEWITWDKVMQDFFAYKYVRGYLAHNPEYGSSLNEIILKHLEKAVDDKHSVNNSYATPA